MNRKFRNGMIIAQFTLGTLMIVIGVVLLFTLPRCKQTQASLEQTLQHTAELSQQTANTMNSALKTSELTSQALAKQSESLNKLGKKIHNMPAVLEKYLGDYSQYVIDFREFIQENIKAINDTTQGMTQSITTSQKLLNANAEAMTCIHAQFTEHKPLVNGVIIAAALFFGFGLVFTMNGIFILVCFPAKNSDDK